MKFDKWGIELMTSPMLCDGFDKFRPNVLLMITADPKSCRVLS